MSIYLIGDVQGCDAALGRLLDALAFSPSRDTLYLLGDLVNRGPDSLAVLQRMRRWAGAAQAVLGNHDLHLLALAHGVRQPQRGDTLAAILQSPEREALLDWLRQQPLALQAHGLLMVHAGVLPAWSSARTLALAHEVQQALRGPELGSFLQGMYGNQPLGWDEDLRGAARLRVIVNALTRLRHCSADGQMDLLSKEGPGQAPPGFMPWFDVPGRLTAGDTVAFGHWSTLGALTGREDVMCLDTGCVWGGCLSALRWTPASPGRPAMREWIQVKCEQAQAPGA